MISVPRSVIPACDVTLDRFEDIVRETAEIPKIGGYKIGFELMLEQGLPELDLQPGTLYNHCSGATDIPDVGAKMMDALWTRPEITGVILTPTSGPVTQEAWVKAAKDRGLKVYLEPELFITAYIESDNGYLDDKIFDKVLKLGVKQGVDGFIIDLEADECAMFSSKIPKDFDILYRDEKGIDANELKAFDVMKKGLPKVVNIARRYTKKPVIYDHQKAATSLPEHAKVFAETCKQSGVDMVIFFPQAGPIAQDIYTKAAKDQGLGVIIGGLMTHPGYSKKEGGYISEENGLKIYARAAKNGIRQIVVPGNRIETIIQIVKEMAKYGVIPVANAPGFVAQKGDVSESADAYSNIVAELFGIPKDEAEFHAIVGRGIYQAKNIKEAAYLHTSKL